MKIIYTRSEATNKLKTTHENELQTSLVEVEITPEEQKEQDIATLMPRIADLYKTLAAIPFRTTGKIAAIKAARAWAVSNRCYLGLTEAKNFIESL